MKRFLAFFTALLLFIAPLAAQSGDSLANLETTHAAFVEAKAASDAAADDAALATATEAAEAEYTAALEAARAERDALKESGSNATRLEELNTGIFAVTGDVALDGGTEAALGLVAQWTEKGQTWITENGPTYAIKVVLFLVILFIFRILSKIAGSITGKALSSSRLKISDLLKKFFVGIVQKVVFVAGLLIALGQVGIDTGPILAGVGVVGFVVGFALQDTLGNFAAGIMILMYRPFDEGDVITAAGETGKVTALTLVSTTLATPDNQKLIIPNSSIWGGTIRNITAQETRRVDFTVGVGYGDDLDKTQKVLAEVASSHELVLKDPEVQVEVVNLGESSVDFVVRPWCKTSDYWTVYFDLTKAFKQRLDAEGISIPFPQRDLPVVAVPEALSAK